MHGHLLIDNLHQVPRVPGARQGNAIRSSAEFDGEFVGLYEESLVAVAAVKRDGSRPTVLQPRRFIPG
jgi:hypothetical protein